MKTLFKTTLLSLFTSSLLLSSELAQTNIGSFLNKTKNINYVTSSGLIGETNYNGSFDYNIGDTIKFSLGKLVLGEAKPLTNGKVTLKTLISNNFVPNKKEKETMKLIAKLFKFADEDNNIKNGIQISSDILSDFRNLDKEYIISNLNETSLLELSSTLSELSDRNYDGKFDNTKYIKKEEVLEENIKNTIAYMGNEERLAYDVYNYLYSYYMDNYSIDIKQLKNIATRSEIRHINIVKNLVEQYNIDINDVDIIDVNNTSLSKNSNLSSVAGIYNIKKIQELYDFLISLGKNSQTDALKAGCMIEVVDINDLDEFIHEVNESSQNLSDIENSYKILRDGSYRHYWSFDQALKDIGISSGCYFEGDELLTNKENIYPR
jgi:hypothetical protein